jgi:hypothetical protein
MGKRGLALFCSFFPELIVFCGILTGAFHRRGAESAEGNLGEEE